MTYLFLAIAIVAEVIATTAMKESEGFSKLGPSLVVLTGYGIAFYLLSIVFKTMPVGVVYAIWAGLGIALVAIVAAIRFHQVPDTPAIVGLILIISGVVVINIFSNISGH